MRQRILPILMPGRPQQNTGPPAGPAVFSKPRDDRYPIAALAGESRSTPKYATFRPHGPRRSLEATEFATLEWVDWFNHSRLPEPIGHIPPSKPKHATMLKPRPSLLRPDSNKPASEKTGAVHPVCLSVGSLVPPATADAPHHSGRLVRRPAGAGGGGTGKLAQDATAPTSPAAATGRGPARA